MWSQRGPLWSHPWLGAGVVQLHGGTPCWGSNPCPVLLLVWLSGTRRQSRGWGGMVGAGICSLNWQHRRECGALDASAPGLIKQESVESLCNPAPAFCEKLVLCPGDTNIHSKTNLGAEQWMDSQAEHFFREALFWMKGSENLANKTPWKICF